MRRGSRILISLMALLIFMVCLPGVAEPEDQVCPPATIGGTVGFDQLNGIEINLQETYGERASLIKQGNCSIAGNSNGTVTIYGETVSYHTVDYLDVEVFLQRWNGSNWVDITSRFYSDSSSIYVRGSSIITVTSGYSYRCRAVHHVRNAGSTSTQTSFSSPLFID